MFVGGAGGTGKSCIINSMKEFFVQTAQENCFHVVSYMGIAACNIGGNTLHFTLSFGHNRSRSTVKNDNGELMCMWDSIDCILVNEVSTMDTQFLEIISNALCRVKGNNSIFGNISVVFIGNFAQLPPVGQ